MQTRQEACRACAAVQRVRRYFRHVNQYFTHTHKLHVNKYEGTGFIFIYPLKKFLKKEYVLLIVWHAIQLRRELINKESHGCPFCFSFVWFGFFVLHVWLQFQLIPMLFALFYIIHVESLVKTHRHTPPRTHTTSISLNRIHAVQPSPQSKAQLTG